MPHPTLSSEEPLYSVRALQGSFHFQFEKVMSLENREAFEAAARNLESDHGLELAIDSNNQNYWQIKDITTVDHLNAVLGVLATHLECIPKDWHKATP